MQTVFSVAAVLGGVLVLGWLVMFMITLPSMRRLPAPRRNTLNGITTIEDAVTVCRQSGLVGGDLVAFAQNLAAQKFSYSRRNPWDTPAQAFSRGMGYCQQQALALRQIYKGLGIDAQPVYAMKCTFPPKAVHDIPEPATISPHTWLIVRIGDEVRDVCCGNANNKPGQLHFKVLSQVRPLRFWMQPFSHLGSVVENIRRDHEALRRLEEANLG